jgi:hypothetical protein
MSLVEDREQAEKIKEDRIRWEAQREAWDAVAMILEAAGGEVLVPRRLMVARDHDRIEVVDTDGGRIYRILRGGPSG